jgi:hypothetical protein
MHKIRGMVLRTHKNTNTILHIQGNIRHDPEKHKELWVIVLENVNFHPDPVNGDKKHHWS